jgi:hypothetical protein
MQLKMANRRSLNGSMTVVGDIAQATGALAPDDWDEVLEHLPDRKPPRSNLIVIPTATVVLVLGIILLLVSALSPVAVLVGWFLEKFSWVLNWSVFTVEDLPYSIITNIHLDVLQSWLILGILVSFIFVFQHKKIGWLYVSVLLALLFSTIRWNHFMDRMKKSQFIVYHVSGRTAVEILDKGKSIFLCDSTLITDGDRIRFHISGNRLFNLINRVDTRPIKSSDSIPLITINNKSFLFANRSVTLLKSTVEPDFVIVNKNGVGSMLQLVSQFPKAVFILDGTCNRYAIRRVKSNLKNAGSIYSVVEKGAYVQNL